MADPTNIWGTYGEDSGGAGTGGPTPSTPDPDGTYAQCNDIEPDAPVTDDRTLWYNIKVCGSTDRSQEWVAIDDATYTLGSTWMVEALTSLNATGPCVYVSDDYELSLLVPENQFPQGDVICGPYTGGCSRCTATCYALTDCLTSANSYTNNDMSAYDGKVTVIAGRCYSVADEVDIDLCCTGTINDGSAAGVYSSCAECDEAINPTSAPCECETAVAAITSMTATISMTKWYSAEGDDWDSPAVCSWTAAEVTLDKLSDCVWYGGASIDCVPAIESSITIELYLDTDACVWSAIITTASGGNLADKTTGETPYGTYSSTWGAPTSPGVSGYEITSLVIS